MHRGEDHLSFKLRKELIEERERAYAKYKVRITAHFKLVVSLNILNSFYMQDAKSGERKCGVELGGEEAGDKYIVNYKPRVANKCYKRPLLKIVEDSQSREGRTRLLGKLVEDMVPLGWRTQAVRWRDGSHSSHDSGHTRTCSVI